MSISTFVIPKTMADDWIKKRNIVTLQEVNTGKCEDFATDFVDLFPEGEIVGTDNFADWHHGAWPGGHCWIMFKGKHFDSEALDGVDCWKDLPFFKRALKNMRTVTWLSKLWVGVIEKPSVIISIGDPGEDLPPFACSHIDVLRIEVDDVDQDLGPEYTLFDWHHARKIIQFADKYKDDDIIVHCAAGVSRSAAVALFLSSSSKRLLDVSKPCSGDYSGYNRWIKRQLEITEIDLKMSKA
ncbi:putative dual-specificity phosphatase [Pseudomonas phage Psa21]|uniref:Putative dual-specificity phosphatase n=1 Tax=Pseudomonas phage Psa21 TaxID=2530023 RepID=A0A481W477_9CAUD|nr:putative dual-specificity phosphatase [Pseudomonas phage Psa21]QBJ02559.1 putative dual-specificity phosphatase [Pseudomonas phage Psa21]